MDKESTRRVDTVLPGFQQGYQQPSFSQDGETQVAKMSTGGKPSDQSGFKGSAEQNPISR